MATPYVTDESGKATECNVGLHVWFLVQTVLINQTNFISKMAYFEWFIFVPITNRSSVNDSRANKANMNSWFANVNCGYTVTVFPCNMTNLDSNLKDILMYLSVTSGYPVCSFLTDSLTSCSHLHSELQCKRYLKWQTFISLQSGEPRAC